MALNFSHRPIFPPHMSSEDAMISPIRIANGYAVEGIPEKGESYIRPRHVNRGVDDCFDYGRDRVDRGGSPESASKDIIDLLPSDPFGMDISTTFTAITGWLEDLEVDYGGYGKHTAGGNKDDYSLFAGLNLIWNSAMRYQSFSANSWCYDKFNMDVQVDRSSEEWDLGNLLNQGSFGSVQKTGCPSSGSNNVLPCKTEESRNGVECSSARYEEALHESLPFALGYLGLQDLLSVERVCRSLHSTIQNDPLLWRNIHIDQPLNEKITDDVLLQLTNRAEGKLQCLSLVECPRITNDGLKRILDSNLKLTKLCVPGCTRLSIEGILSNLRAFKSNKGSPGIKHLRIGGLYGVTHEHFEELQFLLGVDSQMQQNGQKPHFYHRGNFYLLCDDDRAIDIEMCPRCRKFRLVYDCPAEGCQVSDHATQICRACTLCISRCVQCGRCINDSEYEETFCLDLLCSDCFKQVKCQEKQGSEEVGSTMSADHLEPSYSLCLHG